MRYDQSYGIVPLKKEADTWFVFMVRHQSGHWTLPKGHPEGQESAIESATRELHEETGLEVVRLFFEKPMTEAYHFTSRATLIHKTVDYFIAEVTGQITLQKAELQDGKWVELARAHEVATYPQMKALLNTVLEKLET